MMREMNADTKRLLTRSPWTWRSESNSSRFRKNSLLSGSMLSCELPTSAMWGSVSRLVIVERDESSSVPASVASINVSTTRFSTDSYPRISSWRSGREGEKKFNGRNRSRSSAVRIPGVSSNTRYRIRVSRASSARSDGSALDPKERTETGCKNLIRSEEVCLLNPPKTVTVSEEPLIK